MLAGREKAPRGANVHLVHDMEVEEFRKRLNPLEPSIHAMTGVVRKRGAYRTAPVMARIQQ